MSVLQEFYSGTLKDITPTSWDNLIRTIDNKFKQLQSSQDAQEMVAADILKRGLQVIEDGIGPSVLAARESVDQIKAMASYLTAETSSEASLVLGDAEFLIDLDAWPYFVGPKFLVFYVKDSPTNWMAGETLSWNKETGQLLVNITAVNGEGTFADWGIAPTAILPDGGPTINAYTKNETDAKIEAIIGTAPEVLNTLAEVAEASQAQLTALSDSLGAMASRDTVSTAQIANGSVISDKLANNIEVAETLAIGGDKPEFRYKTGGSTDTNWKNVCDVVVGTGLYKGAQFDVLVQNAGTNSGSGTDLTNLIFTVAARRSNAIQDGLDDALVAGPENEYVRCVKTSLGVYQIQVRQPINYRHTTFRIRNTSHNSNVTINYNQNPSDGSTGTIYEVSEADPFHGTYQVKGLYPSKGSIVIADNSVGEILTPNYGGLVFIGAELSTIYPQHTENSLLFYDSGLSLSLQEIYKGLNVVIVDDASSYNGSTGDDGKVTIGCDANKIIIENRRGGNRIFHYTFIGHA